MGVVAFDRSAAAAVVTRIPTIPTAPVKEKSLRAANVLQRLALTRPEKLDFILALALKYLNDS